VIKKTKYILFFVLLILQSVCNLHFAFAQTYTVTPTLIGSTGNFSTASFGSISSSVGEPMVTTLTNTVAPTVQFLTQGFQQPESVQSLSVVASASDSVICAGSITTLTATASGGGPYTYSWTPASGLVCASCQSTSASPSVTTTYTITVSHTVNTATAIVTIVVNPTPTPTIVITPPSNNICVGSHATLTASGGTSYSWSTGQSSSSISIYPTSSTAYTATVTNSSNCSATATHTVNVSPIPSVSIAGGNTSICVGGHATLTASGGGTYSWNTTPIQTTPAIVVSPTATTSYSVFVTNSGGCSAASSITVPVSPSPTVSISATYTTICNGGIFNPLNTSALTATSSGASFLWAPGGQATASITVGPTSAIGSTTYSVTATNVSGCKSVDTIRINVISNPYTPLSVTPNPVVYCFGDSILPETAIGNITGMVFWSTATGTYSYGNPYPLPQNLAVGSYSYWVAQGNINPTSHYECIGQPNSFAVTINPVATVAAGPDITICPGFTAQLSATAGGDTSGLMYEWFMVHNFSDSLVQTSPHPAYSVNPDSTTFYLVKANNNNSCYSAKDTVWVFVEQGGNCELHIYTGITPNGDHSNDAWWIDGIRAFPHNNVSIFNRWGSKVWEGKDYDNDKIIWKGNDNSGQRLPSGTYYYVIELLSDHGNKTYSKWVELTR